MFLSVDNGSAGAVLVIGGDTRKVVIVDRFIWWKPNWDRLRTKLDGFCERYPMIRAVVCEKPFAVPDRRFHRVGPSQGQDSGRLEEWAREKRLRFLQVPGQGKAAAAEAWLQFGTGKGTEHVRDAAAIARAALAEQKDRKLRAAAEAAGARR